ncbi:UNVERIFIED_ORG: hypothetical protein ABIB52_003398 [Arthrobacter sp. UYCu721]
MPQTGSSPAALPRAPDDATVARATGARTRAVAPAGAPPSNVPAGWDRPAPFTPLPVEDTQLPPTALEPDAEPDSGDEPGAAVRRPKWLLLDAVAPGSVVPAPAQLAGT